VADVQGQFEQFHETIRIDFDDAQPLRKERDKALDAIRAYLKANQLPGMDEFLQGSYRFRTGIKPIEKLEYDIDIGLRFSIDPAKYTSAQVRSWILGGLGKTFSIEDKGPCVRVNTSGNYHVDLVSYSAWEVNNETQFKLAHRDDGWRDGAPLRLIEIVESYRQGFGETEDSVSKTDQFRRCVRYLKRWGDERIPIVSDAKPTGLAFVLLAMKYKLARTLTWDGASDDLAAIKNWLTRVLSEPNRLIVRKPTPEYEDALGKLSDADMIRLKQDLANLHETLSEAEAHLDPVAACRRLHVQFGSDFPIPDPKDSAKTTKSAAVITSSRSA
jgi:hypothetical protein